MKRLAIAALVALTLLGTSESQANPLNFRGPYSNGHPNAGQGLFARGRAMPVFMAAPWYLYWPYDGHFQTPAPVGGISYPVPYYGGYGSQPYFTPASPYTPGSPLNGFPGTPQLVP
jgi:hypothetical protein